MRLWCRSTSPSSNKPFPATLTPLWCFSPYRKAWSTMQSPSICIYSCLRQRWKSHPPYQFIKYVYRQPFFPKGGLRISPLDGRLHSTEFKGVVYITQASMPYDKSSRMRTWIKSENACCAKCNQPHNQPEGVLMKLYFKRNSPYSHHDCLNRLQSYTAMS